MVNKYLELTKRILLIVLGLFLSVLFLVFYIKSYSFYQDEYGTDISFNNDYLILTLLGLIVLVYGIISLYTLLKNKENHYFNISSLCFTGLGGFYGLGIFFKQISKGKEFASNQHYLYLGIMLTLLFVYFVINVYQDYKLKTNKQ
jgi:TRAP-type C4-dicarboxylate transport system permease small subunit